MEYNNTRAIIFLVAGLIVFLFPEQVYKFQTYVLDSLHIKYNLKNKEKFYYRLSTIFFIIAIALFLI
jgi:hypothetical protein